MATSWNAADADAGITVDSATKVHRTGGGGTFSSVRTNDNHASGRYYLEYVLSAGAGGSTFWLVGVGNSAAILNNYPGITKDSTGIFSNDGTWFFNNVPTATTITSFTTGDNIGIDFDITNKTIAFRKNGGTWTAANSLSTINAGPYYCMVGLAGGSTTPVEITANWTSASFVYGIPSGASAWDAGGGGGGSTTRFKTLLGAGQ